MAKATIPKPGFKTLCIKAVPSQGGRTLFVNVANSATVATVKQQLPAAGGPTAAAATLLYNGSMLQDAWTTEAIPHGSIIMLFVKADAPPPVPPRRIRAPAAAATASKVEEAPRPDTKGPAAEVGGPTECPICLDEFTKAAPSVSTPCSHCFHGPCLAEWRKHSNFCPLCRAALSPPAYPGSGAAASTERPLSSADAMAALAATRKAVVSFSKATYDVGKSTYRFVKTEAAGAMDVAKTVYKGALSFGRALQGYADATRRAMERASGVQRTPERPVPTPGFTSPEAAAKAGMASYRCPRCHQVSAIDKNVPIFRCLCGQVMRTSL